MKLYHPPSGLQAGLDLLISAEWSPEQALAVVELLDDLRERIWAHYGPVLFDLYDTDRVTEYEIEPADPPF